jgi:hypothetical protein
VNSRRVLILLTGDILTLLLVTVTGFARHNELGTAGWRMMTTFLPLLAAWLIVAPLIGLFDAGYTADHKQIWRVIYTALLVAPLFAWMRAGWLSSTIQPVFITVMGAVTALGMLIWRLLFWVFSTRGS